MFEQRELLELMHRFHTPGLSLHVFSESGARFVGAFGVCRSGELDAVTTETQFQAASLSKAVFATLVWRLASLDLIDLDEVLDFSAINWCIALDGWKPRLTMRQLLTHNAGTNVHGYTGVPRGQELPSLLATIRGDLPSREMQVIVDCVPGLGTRYSSGGIALAQWIVERRFGRTLADLATEYLFEPLGLSRTTFHSVQSTDGTTAHGHPWNAVALDFGWFEYSVSAAAGLWSTAGDLAQLGSYLLTTLRTGESPEFPRGVDQLLVGQAGSPGLGWLQRWEASSVSAFHHDGWNTGFVARMVFDIDGSFALVAMCNANHAGLGFLDDLELFARSRSGNLKSGSQMDSAVEELYDLGMAHPVHVIRDTFVCQLTFPNQPVLEFRRSVQGTHYCAVAVGARVLFFASESVVDSMTLEQDGLELSGKKIFEVER